MSNVSWKKINQKQKLYILKTEVLRLDSMKPKSDIMGWDESQEEAEREDSHQCLTNVPNWIKCCKASFL